MRLSRMSERSNKFTKPFPSFAAINAIEMKFLIVVVFFLGFVGAAKPRKIPKLLPTKKAKLENMPPPITETTAEWTRAVFGSLAPSRTYTDRDNLMLDDEGCIMANPQQKMKNPLLGVDLAGVSARVTETAYAEPDERLKPLLVCVRGTGGGKTRLFEEIRRYLLANSSILPIAITFNAHTKYLSEEFSDADSAAHSAALSIVSRMARAFYGMSLSDVKRRMEAARPQLGKNFEPSLFYSTFISLMRQQLRQTGSNVTAFILFVDETVLLMEGLSSKYKQSMDPLSDLRKVILGSPNGALAFSSLSVSISGLTDSYRPILGLAQSEVLDPVEIVQLWWKLGEVDQEARKRFTVIAAMLGDLPRAVEIAANFIQKNSRSKGDADFTRDLIRYMKSIIGIVYANARSAFFPSPELLYALLYLTPCVLDAESREAIRDSTLTNVVDMSEVFRVSSKNERVPTYFFPHANLVMLSLSKCIPRTFTGNFVEAINGVLESAVIRPREEEGDLLEAMTLRLLNMRIGAAMYAGKDTTPFVLLGLDNSGDIPALKCNIRLTKLMAEDGWKTTIPQLKHMFYKGSGKELLHELRAIPISTDRPVVLLRGAEGDAFDCVLKVLDQSVPTKCHYIFVDSKSKRETGFERERKDLSKTLRIGDFPKNASQAKLVTKLMIGESFAFVYHTTFDIQQAVFPGTRWLLAGRDQAIKFFGPVVQGLAYRLA